MRRYQLDDIFDWNAAAQRGPMPRVELNDETLRDGLQSPSARQPSTEERIRLLTLMATLGIDAASIGMPASGGAAKRTALELSRAARAARLPIQLHCAARTMVDDIAPIADISQKAGIPLGVMAFIGSSPIRMRVEGWDEAAASRMVETAVRFAVAEGLTACLVAEDSTRACPETLRLLYRTALDAGATRVCVCDTVGHATPGGTRALVRYLREEVLAGAGGDEVRIEWHGHNDRGLGLANALAAIEAGASRVHGTALGIGERCGNTAMDQLLMNLHLLGDQREVSLLAEYCRVAATACGRAIPVDYPLVGTDAFRTATGVHAAAIVKAMAMGDRRLADRVYSGVPASAFGLAQRIEVGPASGRGNVLHWLRGHDLEEVPGVVERLLEAARGTRRVLTDVELLTAYDGCVAGQSTDWSSDLSRAAQRG